MTKITDLSYQKPGQTRDWEPEEIAVAVLAILIWSAILIMLAVA